MSCESVVPPARTESPPALDVDRLVELLVSRLAERLGPDRDRLIDRPELARRVGVCERSVSLMVSRGELPEPLLHTAGVARWDWGEVKKFLASRAGRKIRRGRGRRKKPPENETKGEG
ncbi:MAG TPA: hypothetical protein VEL76_30125 [Gemmataceae bacterium]|nr:hypothetical protein [Gemmataceae bacterium]